MPIGESASEQEVARIYKDALVSVLGKDRFSFWWNDAIGVRQEGESVILEVDHAFLLERLRSRIAGELATAARDAFGSNAKLRFSLKEPPAPPVEKPKPTPARIARKNAEVEASTRDPLEPKSLITSLLPQVKPGPTRPVKTMADFLIGPSNQLAAAAAQLVAAQPGAASPLYLHGPTGCGKTHLLEAIRHTYRHGQSQRRVVYMTAEEFTNDFMGALQGSGLPGFRRRYRDVESFLVDDIQFLDGKRATIREFQFTVDTLLRHGRQLVFTADRPPMELDGIGSELAGRLAGGMVCGISSLDMNTRSQLLSRLAQLHGLELARGVAEQMADRLSGDGRLINGVICRLKAAAAMIQGPLTWDVIAQFAGDLLDAGARTVALADIQKAVCDVFGLPTNALQGRGQQQRYSQPRMLAMYLARRYTRAALSEIGDYFGERSHSTVIAANKRVERWVAQGNTVRRGDKAVEISSALQTIQRQLRVS